MKRIMTFLTVIVISSYTFGQKALTFNEAKAENISPTYLDSIYLSGIHTDTSLAVFKNNQDEFIVSYYKMLQDFGVFLNKNDFLWEKSTWGFNRIYFRENGKIDYFLYSFRPGQLTDEQEKRFGELLGKFIIDYQFPMTAPVKFAQCSPVNYVPAPK